MKIFITGASGFIGSCVVKILSKEHEFYAMARSPKSAEKVEIAGVTPVICELGKVTPSVISFSEAIMELKKNND